MPEGKTSKIATTMLRGFRHRDGDGKDRSLAKKGRSPYDNPATKGDTSPGRGVENPIK